MKERILITMPASGPICDFCGAPHVTTAFVYEDFEMIRGQAGSLGNWAACPVCTDLVTEAKWDDLAERCLNSAEPSNPFTVFTPTPAERAAVKSMLLETYRELAVQINGHLAVIQ